MSYAITLRLDAAAAAPVASMWQALALQGVSDEAVRLGYPPHVTLAVCADAANPERLLAAARTWAAQWRELPVTLASLGLFPGPPATLFLAPVVTPELLERHAALLASLLPEPVDPHYLRGRFVPHVTLAGDLTNAVAAIAALSPLTMPITGVLNRLDVVRFRPVDVLESFPLASI